MTLSQAGTTEQRECGGPRSPSRSQPRVVQDCWPRRGLFLKPHMAWTAPASPGSTSLREVEQSRGAGNHGSLLAAQPWAPCLPTAHLRMWQRPLQGPWEGSKNPNCRRNVLGGTHLCYVALCCAVFVVSC